MRFDRYLKDNNYYGKFVYKGTRPIELTTYAKTASKALANFMFLLAKKLKLDVKLVTMEYRKNNQWIDEDRVTSAGSYYTLSYLKDI